MRTKLLGIIVACMSVLTASAQETDIKQFFQIENYLLKTFACYTVDFNVENYTREGYRAGMQTMAYNFIGLETDNDIPETTLDTLTSVFSLTDMYGREHHRFNNSSSILDKVNTYFEFALGNVDGLTSQILHSFSFARGGVYAVRNYIDVLGYDNRDTITIYDDPSLRFYANTKVKTGEDVTIKAFYNTGYPFDISSLTGEEYANVTVYKHLTDSTMAEVYTHQFQLHLKDEAHPLVAAIDTLDLLFPKPEVGSYTIRFESNWDAIDDRNVSMSVEDTLRASVSLDKQAYVLDKDNKASLGIKMDYGYPHIRAVAPDTIPTIRISAIIMQQADTLLYDSLKLVSDTLQTKDLIYDKTWKLDLTKIDQSKLKDAQKQLYVTIHYNGAKQYSAVIPVSIKSTATGIDRVSTTEEDEETVYTLGGMRLKAKGKLPAGIYIRNGKKIVVKP